jgi:hypothetical protein
MHILCPITFLQTVLGILRRLNHNNTIHTFLNFQDIEKGTMVLARCTHSVM